MNRFTAFGIPLLFCTLTAYGADAELSCPELVTPSDLQASLGTNATQLQLTKKPTRPITMGLRCEFTLFTKPDKSPLEVMVYAVKNPGEGESVVAPLRNMAKGTGQFKKLGIGADSFAGRMSPMPGFSMVTVTVLDRSRNYVIQLTAQDPIKENQAISLAQRLETKLSSRKKAMAPKTPASGAVAGGPLFTELGLKIALPQGCSVLTVQQIGEQQVASTLCTRGVEIAEFLNFMRQQLMADGWTVSEKGSQIILGRRSDRQVEIGYSGAGGMVSIGPIEK